MKKYILIQIFALSLVCFWSCSKEDPYREPECIKIAIYDGTPQLDHFKNLLNREWDKAGHKSELMVVPWDNYAGLPDNDASLLIYDGVFYSALRAKGILQPFSNVPAKYSYDWTYTLADGGKYAAPLFLCATFLIFDKDDDVLSSTRYITDVEQETAVPLYSMCAYYYINYMIAEKGPEAVTGDLSKNLDETILVPLRHMKDKWLGSISFENASFSKYQGPERFNKGSVKAIYNFSETTFNLSSRNLSATILDPFPDVANRTFNVDYMSVQTGATEKEAALCEEIISIISSEEFQYEYLNYNDNALYCLPANKAAFSRLAAKYPLYATFLGYSASEMNRPMVLGPDFYEQQDALESKVRGALHAN